VVAPGSHHPADADGDWLLGLSEIGRYKDAYLAGEPWPSGPTPIPDDYVENAMDLWLHGARVSGYHYDIDSTLPGCWLLGAGPTITGVSPDANARGLVIALTGTGFASGADVKLRKARQLDIVATGVSVVSSTPSRKGLAKLLNTNIYRLRHPSCHRCGTDFGHEASVVRRRPVSGGLRSHFGP